MTIQVRLARLQAIRLNEGGDEMYFRQNGRDVRPSGSPDYWRFDRRGEKSIQKTVLEGNNGSYVSINLMEQDGGLRWTHDNLGVIRIGIENNRLVFQENYATSYLGRNSAGFHVVDFTGSDSQYRAYFQGFQISSPL